MISIRSLLNPVLVIIIGLFTPMIFATTPADTLIMAFSIDELTTLDPAEIFEFAGLEYANNTYERLVEWDPNDVKKIKGQLAEKWEVSETGTLYTFTLKPNIVFASNQPITAADVAFSLQRAVYLNKGPASILTQLGLNATNAEKNIVALNDKTITIKIDKAYAQNFVLYCLSSPVAAIVEKNLVLKHQQQKDFGNQWLKTHFAGSGPYMLKNWKANELLSLHANPYYWQSKPKLPHVIIRHVKEASTQQLLLTKGDIDIARNLHAEQIKSLKNAKIIEAPKAWSIYLGLNQQNHYLKIPEVRLAIKYLIDYEGISQTLLKNQAIVHQGLIPKGIAGSFDKIAYQHNIEKAKEFLKAVNLEKGFSITLDTTQLELAAALQQNFAAANIKLNIIPGDAKQIFTKYRARQHDIFLGTWGTDYPDAHANASNLLYNPNNNDDSPLKTIAWRNSWYIPEIAPRVENALLEQDSNKRAKLYIDLQKEVLDDSPIIMMWQKTEVVATQPTITGFILGPISDTTTYKMVEKLP